MLVVGGVELEGGGGLIDRCAYDEEIRIMSIEAGLGMEHEKTQTLHERSGQPSEGYLQANHLRATFRPTI